MSSHVSHTLINELQKIIPDALLVDQQLPDIPIKLWLTSSCFSDECLDHETMNRIWQNTPYWIFCWASGLVMAKWLLKNPHYVQNKVVLDFGSGSGIVAIAAKLAGAKHVICYDVDPLSLYACSENAKLNSVQLEYLNTLQSLPPIDLLLSADVLYDQCNLSLLDEFLKYTSHVWVADSRIKNLSHTRYIKIDEQCATTYPDLKENQEFCSVSIYKAVN